MTMDKLIRFVSDATGVMVAVLAVIGFVASCFAIVHILRRELDELRGLDCEDD